MSLLSVCVCVCVMCPVTFCRIATVVSSDRILALDGGRVKELDTPAELLGDSGSLFSALFRENCSN